MNPPSGSARVPERPDCLRFTRGVRRLPTEEMRGPRAQGPSDPEPTGLEGFLETPTPFRIHRMPRIEEREVKGGGDRSGLPRGSSDARVPITASRSAAHCGRTPPLPRRGHMCSPLVSRPSGTRAAALRGPRSPARRGGGTAMFHVKQPGSSGVGRMKTRPRDVAGVNLRLDIYRGPRTCGAFLRRYRGCVHRLLRQRLPGASSSGWRW